MATILASWELGLRYGHIGHLAPVARALAARGHATVLASRDVVTALTAPERAFDRVLQAPVYLRPPTIRPTLTWGQAVADGGLADPAGLRALVEAWLALFDLVGPDALLAEHAPASLLAAYVAGLPAARIGTSFSVPPASRPQPALMPWHPATPAEIAEADAEANAAIAAVCAAFGKPALDVPGLLGTGRDYLVTWPELDHFGARADVFYYGPTEGLGGRGRPAWPAGDGPRVAVYLPFTHPEAGALIDALGNLGWPAAWHSQSPPERGLPASIAFAANPFDMPHVLGQATVFVGRVGHGSSGDALRAGCAQLLLPDTLETSILAYRLSQARLGLLPSAGKDAAGLSDVLGRLAHDPLIRAAVDAAKARYAGYDPKAAAAELADDLLADLKL